VHARLGVLGRWWLRRRQLVIHISRGSLALLGSPITLAPHLPRLPRLPLHPTKQGLERGESSLHRVLEHPGAQRIEVDVRGDCGECILIEHPDALEPLLPEGTGATLFPVGTSGDVLLELLHVPGDRRQPSPQPCDLPGVGEEAEELDSSRRRVGGDSEALPRVPRLVKQQPAVDDLGV